MLLLSVVHNMLFLHDLEGKGHVLSLDPYLQKEMETPETQVFSLDFLSIYRIWVRVRVRVRGLGLGL